MKLLFHRTSLMVRALELSGFALSAVYLLRRLSRPDAAFWLFCVLLASVLFVKACDLLTWYSGKSLPAGNERAIGIRVHFQKALVPTSYILSATALIALLELPIVSTTAIALAVLMMLVIAPVNGILIHFHRKDRDPLPVNHFSSNGYLAGETSGAPPKGPRFAGPIPLKNQTGKARFDHDSGEIRKVQASGR